MIKWLKNRTRQEKWMLAIVIVLLIGVIVRWNFFKKEAGDAFRHRIEFFKKPDAPAVPDTLPAIDTAGRNIIIIRDSTTL